jgi:hypothetical protein
MEGMSESLFPTRWANDKPPSLEKFAARRPRGTSVSRIQPMPPIEDANGHIVKPTRQPDVGRHERCASKLM